MLDGSGVIVYPSMSDPPLLVGIPHLTSIPSGCKLALMLTGEPGVNTGVAVGTDVGIRVAVGLGVGVPCILL